MSDEPAVTFPQPKVPDLKGAIRRARIEEAERSAISADLRAGELARLDLLRETLAPLYDQLPSEADMFDLALVPGEKPRLFVDIVAHVEMGRDGKTYRLVQTLRAGRLLLIESADSAALAEAVAGYLGRRLVERERALAQDAVPFTRSADERLPAPADTVASRPSASPSAPASTMEASDGARRFTRGDLVFSVLLGLILGAVGLYGVAVLQANGVELPFKAPGVLAPHGPQSMSPPAAPQP